MKRWLERAPRVSRLSDEEAQSLGVAVAALEGPFHANALEFIERTRRRLLPPSSRRVSRSRRPGRLRGGVGSGSGI